MKPKTFDFDDGNGPVPAHRHNNTSGRLGGWVANSASVHQYAFVNEDARVFGLAEVGERSHILGKASVYGRASVKGNAWLGDEAHVFGSAQISNAARVSGRSLVFGDARVEADARVFGSAQVYERAVVQGKAQVFDQAKVFGCSIICESAAVCGSVEVRLDFGGSYLSQIAQTALLEKQADLRIGDGWTAHRLVSGLALNVRNSAGGIEVYVRESWDELPRMLLDHGLIPVEEYLVLSLMKPERVL